MQYQIIAPRHTAEDALRHRKTLPPFDSVVLDFVDSLSGRILADKAFRRFPELMAMAFWMRRVNILKLREKFESEKAERVWPARGIVFHIAPANVDTIFVYSWFLSMLVGNINVVRLSSKVDEQVTTLVSVINDLADRPEFRAVAERFMIVQYEHDDETTSFFSSFCDVRVIWGGDETVRRIRALPLKPTATELVFADKFSMSVMRAQSFMALEKKDGLIANFYNDAYWFGQNACSSPRLVVWLGEKAAVGEARRSFWDLLEKKVEEKLRVLPPAVAVDKLVAVTSVIISASGAVHVEPSRTSLVSRVLLEKPEDVKRDLHCGGGLFYELVIGSLDELAAVISPKDQTVSVFGIGADEWRQFVVTHRPEGINRVVPVGEALSFSAVWDGYDLLREFCREVEIAV